MDAQPALVKRVTGLFCSAMGIVVVLIGLGVIGVDDAKIWAPRFIIVLAGAIFLVGGVMLLAPVKSAWVHVLGFTFYASFAVIFWWVALAAPSEAFENRSLFLSAETDVLVGRLLFGLVALMASIILVYAVFKLVKPRD